VSKKLLVSVGVISVMLLQGCSSNAATGTPSNAASPSASIPSTASAPKVQNPLPASVISKHPCDAGTLTGTQLGQLFGEVPAAQRKDTQVGPGCQWQKTSTGATADVAWLTSVSGGLSQVYSQEDAYRQVLEINGYPALAYNVTQNPPVGDCQIAIGISDSLVVGVGFVVGGNRYGQQNPCDVAKIVAQDVLGNLKASAQ
jgi:hypothetical protein